MKDKFESILLQLKSNLKNPSVTSELKNEYDKELNDKLINVINNYYENIHFFDKQKESLQKLLLENANNLLSNTNSGHFNLYISNYRNYANFLVDNYYENEDNSITTQLSMKKTNEEKARKLAENIPLSMESLQQKESKQVFDELNKEEIIEIPLLKFENLPEKELKFSTWKEAHDWAMKECKEWEYWYQYISDMPNNIKPAMNIQRGATVNLWSKSQKLIKTNDSRDIKRFLRMTIKALHEVNKSNPIVSYSELGKRMIEALDNNPDKALEKYQNEFLRLLKDDRKIPNKTVISNPMIKGIEVENKFYEYLIENKFPNENLIRNKRINYKSEIDLTIEDNNKIVAAVEIKSTNNIRNFNINNNIEILLSYYKFILTLQTTISPIFLVIFDSSIKNFIFFEFDYEKKEIKQINKFPDFESLTNKKSINKNITNYKAQDDAIAPFSKANPHIDDKDSLDIDSDIVSFAKLMAYKNLETPLSIGLFGKWGSGKSFFMNKLEKRINELSETEKNESFCKNVVHVKFNAWHYSDSNLLASLVYNIFDAIDKDINDKKDECFNPIKEKKLLYKELESTAKLLEEKEKKKNELELFIKGKSKEIENKKIEIEKNSEQLSIKDVFDISKVILESPEIKEDIESLKKEFPTEIYTSLNDFKNIYRELNSTFSLILKATYKLFKFNKKDLFIYFIFIILTMIIYYFLNNENFTKYAIDKITTFIVFISPFIYKIKNNFERIKPLFENVKNIIDKWNNIKEAKLLEYNKEIEEEKNRLNILKNELHELNLTIDKTKEEETILKKEIDDILDGKYFRDFISTKVDSEDYKKHLGLISIIRNDFTALEEFLPKLNDNKKYKVDRIILYIDDLDRCSNDLAVNVLEAVHLLLAFKLFVVVVGIDLRWIKGALEDKHKCLFNKDITSEQYIEKIFQIPFKIKSLDNENKQNLIKHLLEEDIKSITIPNPNDETNQSDETIKLTEEEINLIEEIVDSIGDTPRTITRFINIYRIIRSHKYINDIIEDYSDDYKMLIFLLCESFYCKSNKKFNEILSIENKKYYDNFASNRKRLLQTFINRFSFNINEKIS